MSVSKTKPFLKTLDLAYIAIGAVLIAICSWISIPTTVHFTLQTFAVFFVLSLLGGKRGTISVLIYILLGAVGLPVFAQFTAGLGTLLGMTGGYIVGFIFIGLIYWLAVSLFGKKLWVQIVSLLLGLAICYAFGTFWFMTVYAKQSGAIGLATALSWCVIPFILPDLAKLGLALVLSRRLTPVLKLNR